MVTHETQGNPGTENGGVVENAYKEWQNAVKINKTSNFKNNML